MKAFIKIVITVFVLIMATSCFANRLYKCADNPRASKDWMLVCNSAPWGERDAGSVASHDGRLYVLGGWTYSNGVVSELTDTWSTNNGVNWSLEESPWTYGIYTMAISYKNQLFLMGGLKNSRKSNEELSNQVWGKKNGKNWVLLKDHAEWEARIGSSLVEHAGILYVLAGKVESNANRHVLRNDIWKSENGTDWTLVMPSAPWRPRAFQCALSHKGKIFVLGGGDWDSRFAYSDAWSSADGSNWIKHPEPPWKGLIWHSCISYDDQIWIIGGRSFDPMKTVSDIWSSEDGNTWIKRDFTIQPGPRHAAYAEVFKGDMYIMGGSAHEALKDDIWRYSSQKKVE